MEHTRRSGLTIGWLSAAALFAGSAIAQTIPVIPDIGPLPLSLPEAQVGIAYNPPPDEFQRAITQALQEVPEVSLRVTAEGNAPPGISVSGSGTVSGTPTAAGSFSFRIVYRLSANSEIGEISLRILFDAVLAVRGAAGGLGVRSTDLTFSAVRGGAAGGSQSIVVENRSAQSRSIAVTASSRSGNWLSASGGGGIAPFSTTTVSVSADASGLDPGIYQESVRIEANGGPEAFSVPVTLTVTGTERGITLSQNGFSFEAGQGSTAALTRTFDIAAQGAGTLQFNATASVIAGNNWLSVTPASGDVRAATPVAATVRVNPAGLAAGQYYGQIEIRVDGAANSPQAVNAVLNVLPANAVVAPLISPTGLVFVQSRTGQPSAQTISITNVSARAVTFTTVNGFDGPTPNWFSTRAPSRTVNPGQTVSLQVQRESSVRLPAGVHTGEITLGFGTLSRRVAVVLIVLPDAANTADLLSRSAPTADGCTPGRLVPVFTALGSGFAVTAAWPAAIEMRVVDDCGDPMTRGTVSVSFTNGDPPLTLQAFADGRWSGTWQPRAAASNVVLEAAARSASTPALTGTARIGGSAAANAATPLIRSGGIVNSASRIARAPVTPGGSVSILGSALATGPAEANALPLPSDLGGTQVLLGSRRLVLRAADTDRIEAIVPYGLNENASQQLVVRRGNTISMPESIAVASALPAIYTRDGSGTGEAVALAVKPDGTQVPVTKDTPIAAGDELILTCTGLGPVDPSIDAGTAAPEEPRSRTVNPVALTIGGRSLEVTFSGLTPGLAGVYQVNSVIPEDMEPNAAAEVILTTAGQSSAPVTIAVQPKSE